MKPFRFVHAADLHLDSPFTGVKASAPENVADRLYDATFDAYENIVDLCLSERVDALLIAGDVYDGSDRSLRAQRRFVDGLERLHRGGVRSFVCHGNHDPLDGWEARLAVSAELPPIRSRVPGGPGLRGRSRPRRCVRCELPHARRQGEPGSPPGPG